MNDGFRMAKDEVLTVKDAVYKLQLSLLEGIKDENQLFAAGSLMSQGDYQDVVTERNIANVCGYPLCINSLPSERPRKGHYRISLKEHKVYDLHETFKYCSSSCLINSRAFSGALQDERSLTLNPAKLNEVLNMFEGLSLNSKANMGKNGDLGLSQLRIQEKTDKKAGEVSMEEWIGPSNAIEGYVPRRDNNLKPQQTRSLKKEPKLRQAEPNEVDIIFNDMDFSSSIITQDEYSISKLPGPTKAVPQMKSEERAAATSRAISEVELYKSDNNKSRNDKLNVSEVSPDSIQNNLSTTVIKEDTDYKHGMASTSNSTRHKSSLKTSDAKKATRSVTWADENAQGDGKNLCEFRESDQKKEDGVASESIDMEYSISKLPGPTKAVPQMKREERAAATARAVSEAELYKSDNNKSRNDKLNVSEVSSDGNQNNCSTKVIKEETDYNHGMASTSNSTRLKSSLKTSDAKQATHSVTWADENAQGDGKNLCEYRELDQKKEDGLASNSIDMEVGDESYRLSSAKACARALSQAAESVALGTSDGSDAVSESGVIILPPPLEADEAESEENGDGDVDVMDTNPSVLKWPSKSGLPNYDFFDSEDSWYESPPEGFSLTLSPFATMFMALFAWISSSSLAYIYGRDESYHEEYISINGREYPRKIVMEDGRSAEIKQSLAGCLARSLPGLVAELRLPTPISTLEQGLVCLLDTMSFVDPLPSVRMKQWQVIILLFLDALSVSRIPSLTQYMMGRRVLLPKVLEGAQISMEEYEIMKDLIIPLGRLPQFSTQSGG